MFIAPLFLLPLPLSLGPVDYNIADKSTVSAEEETQEVAEDTVELVPAMKPVCACESAGSPDAEPRHYLPDGTVIRGHVNPNDIGACQINLTYHQDTAESMGLDLFDRDDNIRYANWLYRQEGFQPWHWSKPCHGKG